MANVNSIDSTPSLVKIPNNYPMVPVPGKISLLFEENKKDIYHKFNAKDYDGGNILYGSNQPYIYRYIDESQTFLRKLGRPGIPLGLGVDDVIRVTKYVTSGRGLAFLGKQFLLQGVQSFDETNLYNPTEVILSAVANLTGGILTSPKRHIDTSGGLLGGLAALVGVSVSRGTPPPSTVAAGNGTDGSTDGNLFGGFSLFGSGTNRETEVLPVQNYGNGTGLLRAKTANKARSILQSKWGVGSGKSGGILNFIKGIAKSVVPQIFGSDKQNYKQRADDVTYDWMVKYYNDITADTLQSNSKLSISLFGINLNGSSKSGIRQKTKREQLFKQKYYWKVGDDNSNRYDSVVFISTNHDVSDIKTRFNDDTKHENDSRLLTEQKDYYFDTKTWTPTENGGSSITEGYNEYKLDKKTITSTDLVKKSLFVERYGGDTSEYSVPFNNTTAKSANKRSVIQNTKLNDLSIDDGPATRVNDSLKKVIDNINRSDVYKISFTNKNTWLLSSGQTTKQGYDRLHDIAKTPYNLTNNDNSIEREYKDNNVRTLDSMMNPTKNYGFSGNGKSDKINTLLVLDGDKKIKNTLIANYKEWSPYDDDLIAFFFYDVVNEKYIPFRATVKGISESNNALWDELRFMGRADALYSYSGFNRNLSFSFTVIVNSLLELQPVWQRISYLSSCVKPSTYTKKVQTNSVTNNFMVPPMFMLTIGDMYKYQPIVITTLTVNIPENASWETLPENSTEDWSYLSTIIKSYVDVDKIGQVPREIEISIACNVLEKELPMVGGNHFGHAVQGQNRYGNSEFSKNMRASHVEPILFA